MLVTFIILCDKIWINLRGKHLIWVHVSGRGTHRSPDCSVWNSPVTSWPTTESTVTVRSEAGFYPARPTLQWPTSFSLSAPRGHSLPRWHHHLGTEYSTWGCGDVSHVILCFSVSLSSFPLESSTHLVDQMRLVIWCALNMCYTRTRPEASRGAKRDFRSSGWQMEVVVPLDGKTWLNFEYILKIDNSYRWAAYMIHGGERSQRSSSCLEYEDLWPIKNSKVHKTLVAYTCL